MKLEVSISNFKVGDLISFKDKQHLLDVFNSRELLQILKNYLERSKKVDTYKKCIYLKLSFAFGDVDPNMFQPYTSGFYQTTALNVTPEEYEEYITNLKLDALSNFTNTYVIMPNVDKKIYQRVWLGGRELLILENDQYTTTVPLTYSPGSLGIIEELLDLSEGINYSVTTDEQVLVYILEAVWSHLH